MENNSVGTTMSQSVQNRQTRDEIGSDAPAIIPVFKRMNERIRVLDQQISINQITITSATIVGRSPWNEVGGSATVVGKVGTDNVSFVDNSSNIFTEDYVFTTYVDTTNTTGTKTGNTYVIDSGEFIQSGIIFKNATNPLASIEFTVTATEDVTFQISTNGSSWSTITSPNTFVSSVSTLYYKIISGVNGTVVSNLQIIYTRS